MTTRSNVTIMRIMVSSHWFVQIRWLQAEPLLRNVGRYHEVYIPYLRDIVCTLYSCSGFRINNIRQYTRGNERLLCLNSILLQDLHDSVVGPSRNPKECMHVSFCPQAYWKRHQMVFLDIILHLTSKNECVQLTNQVNCFKFDYPHV